MDPQVEPLGSRILVQVRSAKKTITLANGQELELPAETRETEQDNTNIAKVLAVGPLAFRNREKMTLWPEGAWCSVGDFVRVPLFGGDRFTMKNKDGEKILFIVLDDLNVIAKVTGNPLAIKAYI
jgi:co-chaperonin GroES (HSP10)